MKESEIRKFFDEDVVGQLRNGLFFEASVRRRDGKPTVVETSEDKVVNPSEIKWLTTAQRYC